MLFRAGPLTRTDVIIYNAGLNMVERCRQQADCDYSVSTDAPCVNLVINLAEITGKILVMHCTQYQSYHWTMSAVDKCFKIRYQLCCNLVLETVGICLAVSMKSLTYYYRYYYHYY